MRRNWRIQRRLQPTADAEQRWDRAYQHLLEWTRLEEPKAHRPGMHIFQEGEVADENDGNLCSGID